MSHRKSLKVAVNFSFNEELVVGRELDPLQGLGVVVGSVADDNPLPELVAEPLRGHVVIRLTPDLLKPSYEARGWRIVFVHGLFDSLDDPQMETTNVLLLHPGDVLIHDPVGLLPVLPGSPDWTPASILFRSRFRLPLAGPGSLDLDSAAGVVASLLLLLRGLFPILTIPYSNFA